MIALIGGRGNIARRYQAVLNYLEQPFRIIDIGDSKSLLEGCEKAIIATPTDAHEEWCWECSYLKIPFLCEKPLSKKKESIQAMMARDVVGYVVNNWAFVSTNFNGKAPTSLFYDFYNTGKDGLVWDVCQLILLADKSNCSLEVRTDSYYWDAAWGEETIPYSAIEQSYMQMIRAFVDGDTQKLWNLSDAYRMTDITDSIHKGLEGEECEGFCWNSGEKWFETFPKEDFSDDREQRADQMEL